MPTDFTHAVLLDGTVRATSRPISLRLISSRQVRALRTGILAAAVAFAVGAIAMAGAAVAIASPGGERMTPGEARMGTLLFKTGEAGTFVSAPRLGTDIDIAVSGATARGRITQHFQNPTEGWVEAVYVMPLPEDSAVDTLRMVVGNKVVLGEIKERAEAREIYEAREGPGPEGRAV